MEGVLITISIKTRSFLSYWVQKLHTEPGLGSLDRNESNPSVI